VLARARLLVAPTRKRRRAPYAGLVAAQDLASPLVAAEPARNVLVLGSTEHPEQVTSYSWASLPGYVNFADFDVVSITSLLCRDVEDPRLRCRNFPQAPQELDHTVCADTQIVIRDLEARDESHDWFWTPIRLLTERPASC
jgi:hypothetical protein